MTKSNLMRIMLATGLTAGLLTAGSPVWADDTAQLKEQVAALQDRVNQLEAELSVDPFTQAMMMRRQMERNMHQALADTGELNPKMDIKQTEKQYLVTMDIPGMDKDKINVEIKDGMLTISGERSSETQDNKNSLNNQYSSQEKFFGSFMQAMPLPEDAQSDQVQADYKNGVLTVTIARMKKEEKKSGTEKIMVK